MILFLIAYILMLPLTLVNFLFVKDKKGYFRSTAVNLDKFGNMEFRTLFNKVLIKKTVINSGMKERQFLRYSEKINKRERFQKQV